MSESRNVQETPGTLVRQLPQPPHRIGAAADFRSVVEAAPVQPEAVVSSEIVADSATGEVRGAGEAIAAIARACVERAWWAWRGWSYARLCVSLMVLTAAALLCLALPLTLPQQMGSVGGTVAVASALVSHRVAVARGLA